MFLAHVILYGDIRRYPALRSLLWQWGVTVGRWPEEGRTTGAPTVEDCDAFVILADPSHPAGTESAAMPDGAEAEGVAAPEAAPLLVIGEGPVPGTPWVTIPEPGPLGCRLKAALQSCQDRSRLLRGDTGSRHDLDQFRDFLGHELRSPLTAIKTALAILATEGQANPAAARMMVIARRNLNRLQQTVEWSQELMALTEASPAAELAPTRLAALATAVPGQSEVAVDPQDASCEVLTDPGLLGTLAGQMERVLSFACPGCQPIFRLEIDRDSGDCRLIAAVAGDRRPGGPAAAADAPRAGTWNPADFKHLVRMMISPHLLQMLGARTRVAVPAPGFVELSLVLPVCGHTTSSAPVPSFAV